MSRVKVAQFRHNSEWCGACLCGSLQPNSPQDRCHEVATLVSGSGSLEWYCDDTAGFPKIVSKGDDRAVQEQIAAVPRVRWKACEPNGYVEVRLERRQRPMLDRIDQDCVVVDALGFNVDCDGPDRRDADEEIWALDFAL